MDYVEAFRNLKTNTKYSRKSPDKAVLLLSILEMYEKNVIEDNIIRYDEALISTFLKVWKRVVEDNPIFKPEIYLPFWLMQSEDFWHVVPKRGKEDILTLLRDTTIKPSEAKLIDSVDYAELDEDLYFLMTLSSGRSSLKRALLETYTDLSRFQIDRYSMSKDNTIDYSESAFNEYQEILSSSKKESKKIEYKSNLVEQFEELDYDLQIVLCYEYYAYLKSHRSERGIFKEMVPSVYDLYNHIIFEPLKREGLSPSFVPIYENFLSNLKISLMSEDNSFDLIDKISIAIERLNENDQSLHEELSEGETKDDTISYGCDIEKETLLIDDSQELDYRVENMATCSSIINKSGEWMFTVSGKLKIIKGKIYRFKMQKACFTVKEIVREGEAWVKGPALIVAYDKSKLYGEIKSKEEIDDIEDIKTNNDSSYNKIKVDGAWYDYDGNSIDESSDNDLLKENQGAELFKKILGASEGNVYEPKGKMRHIKDVVNSSYDILWIMSVVEFQTFVPKPTMLSYDKLACMMISIAFELLNENKSLCKKDVELSQCINFLIRKSKQEMPYELTWDSSRKEVFNAIKDFPMSDIFEDTVDNLTATSPLTVLKAWFPNEDDEEIISLSDTFYKSCLYAIRKRKYESYIEMNKQWMRSLLNDHDKLMDYFKKLYYAFLDNISIDESVEVLDLGNKVEYGEEKQNDDKDSDEYVPLTKEIIERGRTPNGGFTKSQLAAIGVSWPPAKDWIENTIGKMVTYNQIEQFYKIRYIDNSSNSKVAYSNSSKKQVNNQFLKRKNALLRAMSFFRVPASLRDITRTISRTAWGEDIIEDDVKRIIKSIDEIEVNEEGKFYLNK